MTEAFPSGGQERPEPSRLVSLSTGDAFIAQKRRYS